MNCEAFRASMRTVTHLGAPPFYPSNATVPLPCHYRSSATVAAWATVLFHAPVAADVSRRSIGWRPQPLPSPSLAPPDTHRRLKLNLRCVLGEATERIRCVAGGIECASASAESPATSGSDSHEGSDWFEQEQEPIPKGLHHSAQGCAPSATLGATPK